MAAATNGAVSHKPIPGTDGPAEGCVMQETRVKAPFAELNLVTDICGKDEANERGYNTDAPLPLPEELTSGLDSLKDEEFDLIIVGAGLSGAVLAERCTKELGMKVLILDKRDHIGGNCYDYIDEYGIRVSLYGVHLFHTKFERVWNYVTQFSEWVPYEHRVKGREDDVRGDFKVFAGAAHFGPVQQLVRIRLSGLDC